MRLGLILSVLAIGFFAGCNTSVTTVDYTTSTKTGAACDLGAPLKIAPTLALLYD